PLFYSTPLRPPSSTLFPYTTLFRSNSEYQRTLGDRWSGNAKIMRPMTDGKYGASTLYAEFAEGEAAPVVELTSRFRTQNRAIDRSEGTRLNSSHDQISYAVFCLKKK